MTRYEFEQTVEQIKTTHKNHITAIPALINIRRLFLREEGKRETRYMTFKWAARKALV